MKKAKKYNAGAYESARKSHFGLTAKKSKTNKKAMAEDKGKI